MAVPTLLAGIPDEKQAQAWVDEYRRDRTLEHATTEQLKERLADLFKQVITFDERGGAARLDGSIGKGWTQRIVCAEEELRVRGFDDAAGQIAQQVLSHPYPNLLRACDLWPGRKLSPGSYLVKYGQRDHIAAMLERGAIRIAPASTYSDPSLSPAARDSELEHTLYAPKGTVQKIKIDGEYKEIPGIVGPLAFTGKRPDYYVFCASGRYDPRAFDEFGYDACLVIRDWRSFANSVVDAFAHEFSTKKVSTASVFYEDPFFPLQEKPSVHFGKHFRYAYQREWRIVWEEPIDPPAALEPLFIELGRLEAYCDALYL